MFRALLISFFALVLAACGGSDNAAGSAPAISIENASLRLPAPGQTKGTAYFDVVNNGGADVLLSAATPFSSRVELHTHLHEDGMMKMRQVETVDIGPETVTHFKTGGLHVMIFNMDVPEGATHMPLTLTFATSGAIDVSIKIGGAAEMTGHEMKDMENPDMHSGH